MFPSPSLPWFELARFRRNRLTRAALIAVMLVPLFYGALYVWANLNPTGNLDNVRTAVLNEDQLVEVIALATGVVFTAINQMFIAVFGGAGRFLALVFICPQLTAAGGTYPIETAPSFFGSCTTCCR